MPIRLTYPVRSHDVHDLKPLYEEFKAQDLDRFKDWQRIERKGNDLGPDDLKFIQQEIIEFLKERSIWDSHAALVSAFSDFRRLLARETFWS